MTIADNAATTNTRTVYTAAYFPLGEPTKGRSDRNRWALPIDSGHRGSGENGRC